MPGISIPPVRNDQLGAMTSTVHTSTHGTEGVRDVTAPCKLSSSHEHNPCIHSPANNLTTRYDVDPMNRKTAGISSGTLGGLGRLTG